MWQDIVITTGGFIMIIALLPTVRGNNKPDRRTSIITGIILSAFSISYLSLHLWLSSVTTMVMAVMWFILYYQAVKGESK